MGPGKEAGCIALGTAIVEGGPPIIDDLFEEMGGEASSIMAESPLGESFENAVDFAQDITPAVATLAFIWLGFKVMLKGLWESDSSKKGHSSIS